MSVCSAMIALIAAHEAMADVESPEAQEALGASILALVTDVVGEEAESLESCPEGLLVMFVNGREPMVLSREQGFPTL